MNTIENDFKKITFRYFSNILEEDIVETMWAEVINEEKGIFRLYNIPFYGPLIAPNDVFYAEYDESEETWVFRKVIESSGNSVIQVVIMKVDFDKEIIRKELVNLGCESEGMKDNFFSIEVPKSIDYKIIKNLLDKYENEEIIEYAEPILSIEHQNNL